MVKRILIATVIFFSCNISIAIELKNKEVLPSIDKETGIFVKSLTEKTKFYKYEPFIYSMRLYTHYTVSNVKFTPLTLDDVTVKPLDGYKTLSEKHKGRDINVIELNYIITPIKPGKITIPAFKATGIYSITKTKGFGGFLGSFFEDEKIRHRQVNMSTI